MRTNRVLRQVGDDLFSRLQREDVSSHRAILGKAMQFHRCAAASGFSLTRANMHQRFALTCRRVCISLKANVARDKDHPTQLFHLVPDCRRSLIRRLQLQRSHLQPRHLISATRVHIYRAHVQVLEVLRYR